MAKIDDKKRKVVAFDLDDTLCFRKTKEDKIKKYEECKPIPEMIKVVNDCYERGHEIVIYTARGMFSLGGNRDEIYHHLYDLTREQLEKWGIKYHKLILGKAYYDVLIDDKVVHTELIKSADDVEEFLK